jgi:hypothetical protein
LNNQKQSGGEAGGWDIDDLDLEVTPERPTPQIENTKISNQMLERQSPSKDQEKEKSFSSKDFFTNKVLNTTNVSATAESSSSLRSSLNNNNSSNVPNPISPSNSVGDSGSFGVGGNPLKSVLNKVKMKDSLCHYRTILGFQAQRGKQIAEG